MPDEPFITQHAQGSYIAQAANGGTANINVVLPPTPIQERNRIRFLARLYYQYNELWEQTLQGITLMTLRLTEKPNAVQHQMRSFFLSPQLPEHPLPPSSSIVQVYDKAENELLLLGEPGVGKSTLLLDLARQLVERAKQNTEQQLPIILPLSSWAQKRPPFKEWLIEQISLLYYIPLHICRIWVHTDQFLLLLDGLDEVPRGTRLACIEAINAYHNEHLIPLVVCSRRSEYEEVTQSQRLRLLSAVVIESLTSQQVETYLIQAGPSLATVRAVLHANPVLKELITTPLMLSILTLTYSGASAQDLPHQGSADIQQQEIFASYIERMVERKGDRKRYPLQSTKAWLGWLAWQMREHNQTVFYIEQLQSNWLFDPMRQQIYTWLAVRLPGILMGALLNIIVTPFFFTPITFSFIIRNAFLGGWIGWLLSSGSVSPSKAKSTLWHRSLRWLGTSILFSLSFGGIIGEMGGSNYGLIRGLIFGIWSIPLQIFLERRNLVEGPPQKHLSKERSWQHLIRNVNIHNGLLIGVGLGLGFGLSNGLVDGFIYGLNDSLNEGLIYGLNGGLTSALTYGFCYIIVGGLLSVLLVGKSIVVQPNDKISLSLSSLGKSLISKEHLRIVVQLVILFGLGAVLAFGISDGLINGLNSGARYGWSYGVGDGVGAGVGDGLIYGLIYWLLLGLLQGVSSDSIEDQYLTFPNQRIHHSASNGLILGLVSAIIVVVSNVLTNWLNFGPQLWLNNWLVSILNKALSLRGLSPQPTQADTPLVIYLVIGVSTVLLVGLSQGWLACLRHYVLRFQVWWAGLAPWDYVQFLEDGVHRILLRKIGGGYIFNHRLFLDSVAEVETTRRSVCICKHKNDHSVVSFCPRCGKPIKEDILLPSPQVRIKLTLIIGSVVLVIALMSLSIFAFIQAMPKSFSPPSGGVLVLNDPLHDNSKGYNWQEANDTNGSCLFKREAYHVSTQRGGYYYACYAQNTEFTNFAYEVQMQIIKGGCGAFFFRTERSTTNFYYLRICHDSTYALYSYGSSSAVALNTSSAYNSAIHAGLGVSNIVTVVAQGHLIELYMNHQKIDSLIDNTYSHGLIGVGADGGLDNLPTEVIYSNAKVWTSRSDINRVKLAKSFVPPSGGVLVLNDPLHDNSKGYNWQEVNDTNGSCLFKGRAYHVSTQRGGYYYACYAQNTEFTNFAYEVQMQIIKGDCGVLLFRTDKSTTKFYYLRICHDSTYALYSYDRSGADLIPPTYDSAIHTGLGVSNIITVVAQSHLIELYVNHQKINSLIDNAYSHGQIGVAVDGALDNQPTEVIYSNIKLWTI